jgi:phage-related protein
MKGVSFLGYHSEKDLNLLLTGKEIGAPEIKRQTIDVAGSDGELDFTDFFGEPKYGNAQHQFTFESIRPRNEQLSQYTDLKNKLHGKKGRIILDDDPSFFYVGRCTVSKYTNEKNIGKITVTCDCEPYKYKLTETVVTRAVNGTDMIVLTNSRKRAVPLVTVQTSTSMDIVYKEDFDWSLASGSYLLPELELAEGDNVVTVIGTGTISFTWREAVL